MYGAAKLGMHYVAYGPKDLWPDESTLTKIREVAVQSGAIIELSDKPECVKGADVIYTDVWVSMGEEDQMEKRVEQLSAFRVTMEMLKNTGNNDVIFMHCLPAYHDFETGVAQDAKARGLDIREVTDEVFRSKHSVVFDEAENRMHTIKAVMVATL